MSTAISAAAAAQDETSSHGRRCAVLALLIAALFVSTALHYAHNYIEIEHYPPTDLATNNTIRIAILVAWPTLTGAGITGYFVYASGRYALALPLLASYSLLGLATLGHFTEGSPHIGAFWYATIFTDAIFGIAILSFAIWSAVIDRRSPPA